MSNDKPVSVILNAAADDLEVNGWRRGSEGMLLSGPHCLLGAIAANCGESLPVETHFRTGTPGYQYDALQSLPAVVAVQDYLQLSRVSPFIWNDEDGRTADEVVAALRAAAVIAASRETEPTTQPSGEAVPA